MAVFGERLTRNEWIGIALHRRRPRDHFGRRVDASRRGVTAVTEPTPLEGG